MRSDPSEYRLVSPGNLQAALSLLAWRAGSMAAHFRRDRRDGSLLCRKAAQPKIDQHLEYSRASANRSLPDRIRIGAACTYTALRKHDIVSREFPLLAIAASWTGGIANQNRGTLGGNIANASPAADSLPALLVYGR